MPTIDIVDLTENFRNMPLPGERQKLSAELIRGGVRPAPVAVWRLVETGITRTVTFPRGIADGTVIRLGAQWPQDPEIMWQFLGLEVSMERSVVSGSPDQGWPVEYDQAAILTLNSSSLHRKVLFSENPFYGLAVQYRTTKNVESFKPPYNYWYSEGVYGKAWNWVYRGLPQLVASEPVRLNRWFFDIVKQASTSDRHVLDFEVRFEAIGWPRLSEDLSGYYTDWIQAQTDYKPDKAGPATNG